MSIHPSLKLGMSWKTREGDYVADVFHAGRKEDEPLEAEPETGVGDGAVFAEFEIPPVIFPFKAEFGDFLFEDVEPFFALGAADDFADFGDEDVHGGNCFAIGISAHIEGFDLGGIVGDDDRFFAVFFREIPLVFGLEIGAPFNGEFEFFRRFFEDFNGLRVRDMGEGGRGNMLESGE